MAKDKGDKSKDKGKTAEVVDPAAVTGEGGKQLPAAKSSPGAELASKSMKDLLSSMGVDGSNLNAIDEAVADRASNNEDRKALVNPTASDLDKAKALEGLSAIEMCRGEVISDIGMESALADKDFRGALEYVGAKQRIRADHFNTLARRQKMEVDNLQLHRKQITLGIINKVTLELSGVLKEVGLDEKQRDEVLTKLAERSAVMVSD